MPTTQNKAAHAVAQGAWILSLASLIAKILSALYRVPLQNLVGDTGFYVYQQVYPLYGIGMTFALSGYPVFISKLVAEAKDPLAKHAVAHRSLVLLTWLSWLIFLAMQVFADTIAGWMGDRELAVLIQVVGFMFLTMPLLATARGYFQGTFDMTKTAISQVFEQVVRVAVILFAAWWALRVHWTVYQMGAVAMSGAFFGGAAAILSLWRPWTRSQRGMHFAWPGWRAYGQLARRFITEGGSIALFAALLIILQLIDSFTVTKALTASGVLLPMAKVLKGVYDRGQPLVQLGLVVATALSATLMPKLTAALSQRRLAAFRQVAGQLVHLSAAISVAAAAGLVVLMPAINWLLFGDAAGTVALQFYVVSIALVGLINAYSALLQSAGRIRGTAWALVAGFVVKIVLNTPLTQRFGTTGAAAATVLALGLMLDLIYVQVPATWLPERRRGFGWKLAASVGCMVLVVHFAGLLVPLTGRLTAGLVGLGGALLGVLVFVAAATVCHLLTPREVMSLPFGRHYLRWLQRHS
ncbi:polysaccharide biosynthesis protein [Lacticaseibacillus mingshuiensis]|uniref:Polysaccharide biosynthesis protein n=1 Tax=Lacticaseibacillus mingshuiensis TaxID=2799574 RepID=A0ABW4CLT3_9LACO|nr:polysaccharide biosynthesis protein [Lacticaseibacillus mingshuiensis]